MRHSRRPRHAKPSRKVSATIGAIVTILTVGLITTAFLLLNNGGWQTVLGQLGYPTSPSDTPSPTAATPTGTTNPLSSDQQPVIEPLPPMGSMRGVYLTAGVDYLLQGTEDAQTLKQQIDAAFAAMEPYQIDTVLLPLQQGDKPLYGASYPIDPIACILETARAKNMKVYGILDLQVGSADAGRHDPALAEGREKIAEVARLAAAYPLDGFFLKGYSYPAGQTGSQAEFAASSLLGTDFDAYLTSCVQQAVTAAKTALRHGQPKAYVGLMADPVWASDKQDERGLPEAVAAKFGYASLTDGHADTLAMMESGVADAVLLQNDSGNLADYEAVLNWWSQAAGQLPLYTVFAADKVGGQEAGWNQQDCLAKQILACQKLSNWKGGAFNSLGALQKHPNSTAAAIKALSGNLQEDYISRTLTLTSPHYQDSVAYESRLNIRGSADPNFPLLMNGKPVTLTDHGFFSLDVQLQPGKNTFTFEHKGSTVTYTVTYKIQVLQSIAPTKNLTLEGDSTLTLSGVARKGSVVTATLGGKTITLKVSPPTRDEDQLEDLTDFETYTGNYQLPAAGTSDKNLGKVTFTATYQGLKETKTGGSITVKGQPAPSPSTTQPSGTGTSGTGTGSTGTGSSGGTTQPTIPSTPPTGGGQVLATGKILAITADYAETFSGGLANDYSRPINSYLPQGTMDLMVKTAYDAGSDSSYYVLGSGRMVYQQDAKIIENNGQLRANTLKPQPVARNHNSTTISIDADWRLPYNLRLLPQSYANEANRNYSITAQTYTYVDIQFYYTDGVAGNLDLTGDPLFSKAEWIKGSDHTYTLRLHLRRTGGFYGYAVKWNGNRLTFTFRYPTDISGNSPDKPLKGITVVIDPGHGGNSIGTAGGNIAEKTMTLLYSQQLRDKLVQMGAKVVMTRETDVNPSLLQRVQIARAANADLFVSIHMNGATSASAKGHSLHYFYEYSQPLAKVFYEKMNEVYASYKSPSTRGYKWDPFYVTRNHNLPSILVECGFMTNAEDLERIISPAFQDKLTTAMAQAVLEYCRSLPVLQPNPTSSATTQSAPTSTTLPQGNPATTAAAPMTAATTKAREEE